MTADERLERERTFVVLPFRLSSVLSHVTIAVRHPLGYARGLMSALRLSDWNLKKALLHLAYFGEAVIAGREIERAGMRHVHVHFSSTVALLLGRVFPIEFSVTIHGPDEFNDVHGFRLAEKVAAARFVCTISAYARSQLMRASDPRHWAKIEVCPLGVDPTVFAPRPPREVIDRFELVCVGRLAPVKAQQVLIGACARLISAGCKLRLQIIGDGPDRTGCRRLLSPVVWRNMSCSRDG
jgi:glycosyltransferase involved in cell wall biosynthesis